MQEIFMKKEKTAFFWVNVGVILLLVAVLAWRYLPALHVLHTPCAIHELLHLYCPGCGGTRAVYALLDLHLWRSFCSHPIVLFLAVLFVEYYIGAIITLIRKNGKRYYFLRVWFCYVALGIVIVNVILRNVLLVYFHIDYMYLGDLLPYWT